MKVPWIRHGFWKGDVKNCKEVIGLRFGDVFRVGIFYVERMFWFFFFSYHR